MARLAKLRRRESLSWRIWETLARYAYARDDRSGGFLQERDFQALISNCMDWVGGDKDDIADCRDMRDGSPLNDLAIQYRPDIRLVLAWLSDPDQHSELAARAARFLGVYGTGIKMDISANPTFAGENADEPLLMEWPEPCESVIAPVCKFILEQIERHDIGGEALTDVVPLGLCGRSGCGRFFVRERAGRGRFCSDKCRAGAYQEKLTKGQRAARMRKYRATLKELRNKPIRFAKKKRSK
jgi:ribosomal protein L24E